VTSYFSIKKSATNAVMILLSNNPTPIRTPGCSIGADNAATAGPMPCSARKVANLNALFWN
jgi:hypothetical protein